MKTMIIVESNWIAAFSVPVISFDSLLNMTIARP